MLPNHNDALLVTLENVYAYGPTHGTPMTEDLPLAATTVKGRARAAMTQELLAAADAGRVQIAIGRASDFFGAGVTETTLGERVFANAVAGKRADFLGNPNLLHTYSYVPDIAVGLATLGTDARAVGQVWHLPGPETVTTRALLDLVAGEVGTSGGRALGPQVGHAGPRPVQPDHAGVGGDDLRVRRALRARHHQVRVHLRGDRYPSDRSGHRDGHVVPNARERQVTDLETPGGESEPKGCMVETGPPCRGLHPAGLRRPVALAWQPQRARARRHRTGRRL